MNSPWIWRVKHSGIRVEIPGYFSISQIFARETRLFELRYFLLLRVAPLERRASRRSLEEACELDVKIVEEVKGTSRRCLM